MAHVYSTVVVILCVLAVNSMIVVKIKCKSHIDSAYHGAS